MSVFPVLEKLAPYLEKEVKLIVNSKQQAQALKSKLERVQDGLQEAERDGVTNKDVERWLGQLEDVMNEMDDALDLWETMDMEVQIEQTEYEELSDPWEKVKRLTLSFFLSFAHGLRRRELTQGMISLSGRLDKILEERGKYKFVNVDRRIKSSLQVDTHECTSYVDKSKVYGRKSDTRSLVDLLLSKGDKESGPLVVSIVGTGGLGKTTLAQLAFNDRRIHERFGWFKAWVNVQDPFDALQVTKHILASFDIGPSNESTLEMLGKHLKAIALRRNILLVLDNVRTVKRANWESFKNFLVGEKRFRILVTTRDAKSAETIGTTHSPYVGRLSDSDCADILNTIALKGKSKKIDKFCKIGFQIAKKCNGLPLTAKTIGHALESRLTTKEWKEIRDSPLWMHEDGMDDVFRHLRLTYMELSPLLKRCFLSSVIYSKGFKFDSQGLIRIWTAQGYLDTSSDWDQIVAKGQKYLNLLTERYFFQVSRRNDEGNRPTYEIDDIMFQFATYLSGNGYYVIIDGRTNQRPYRMPTRDKTRYFCARFVTKENLEPYLFKLLNRARVLCLSDCDYEEFSEDLGKLIYLRYLDLSGNLMKELPENVTNLYNLQMLDLRRCRNLIKLPRGLKKLIKLRHLLISDTDILLEFREELSKLSGLWTIDKFAATRDSLLHSNPLRDSVIAVDNQMGEAEEAQNQDTVICDGSTEMRSSNVFACLNLLGCLGLFNARDEAAAEVQSPDMTCRIEEPALAPEESLDQSSCMITYIGEVQTTDIQNSTLEVLGAPMVPVVEDGISTSSKHLMVQLSEELLPEMAPDKKMKADADALLRRIERRERKAAKRPMVPVREDGISTSEDSEQLSQQGRP